MSVNRVLGILESLSAHESGFTLAELTRTLACPKPSLLALLNELVALQYLRRDEHGRFVLASRSYRLAVQVSASGSLHRVVRNSLIELCEKFRMTSVFGYLDPDQRALVYADRCEGNAPVRYAVKLGARLDIHSRSLGKLLLAHEPEAEWHLWLGREPYARFTQHTRTTLAALAADLRRIRGARAAWTRSEQYEGIGGCALPVAGADGKVAAGLALQGPLERIASNRAGIAAGLNEACTLLAAELALRSIDARTLPMFV